MLPQTTLDNIAHHITTDVDGCLGASIVDRDTGFAFSATPAGTNIDINVAAAFYAQAVNAKEKTLRALGGTRDLDDMVVTFEDEMHIITAIDANKFVFAVFHPDVDPIAQLHATIAYHSATSLGTIPNIFRARRAAAEHFAA
ncbi:hypothetical protein QP027_08445 [Corynebacterium breve]|uniref:Roadblock/LC7 domain-containing protein n=1 Tax=Corynebacterium breve TaxID=3049799 RepID=A0ABY8VBU8_9CORY|nr:hypothetical protein [Corynebacterium breve]WIM67151.1 hypothetical protein QP027_08445 [Corynebacterium breve]